MPCGGVRLFVLVSHSYEWSCSWLAASLLARKSRLKLQQLSSSHLHLLCLALPIKDKRKRKRNPTDEQARGAAKIHIDGRSAVIRVALLAWDEFLDLMRN